jgi:signal transduction histidine kinase
VGTGPGAVTLGEAELREGFAAFIAASRRLEQSYAALQARAQAVDLELAETNRRLEEALREREAIFRALPLGLVALRSDGAVTFRNREGERLDGLARTCGVDLLSDGESERVLGDAVVRVRRVDLPDGRLLLLEDRSRMAELEREVHRLDKLAGLSELALGVAHEIKNPLNGVMGFAALLERSPDPDTCRRHAGRIVQGLRQVDGIVQALLGFARPEGRRGPALPVGLLASEAARAVDLPATQLEVSGDAALRGQGDVLLRVLSVLFRNSLEAGGPGVTVRVQASASGGRLRLVIADDGPGVPAGLGDRVFAPFVSTKERGTGLGLPLAARLLSFLGGDLALLNPGEPGARFQVRLPLHHGAARTAAAEAAP